MYLLIPDYYQFTQTTSQLSVHRRTRGWPNSRMVCSSMTLHLTDLELTRFHRSDMPAPEIAIDYWRLAPDAKLLDVIYAVRSDESTHRFVNHSFANLDKSDINPFALREPDMNVKGKKLASVLNFSLVRREYSFFSIFLDLRNLRQRSTFRSLRSCSMSRNNKV